MTMPVRVSVVHVLAALFILVAGPGVAVADQPPQAMIDSAIGTVVRHENVVCMRVAHPGLLASARVMVVRADTPQAFAAARVIGESADCPGGAGASGYQIELMGDLLKVGAVGLAVLAEPSALTIRGGIVSLRLPGVPSPLVFHDCASTDGIHVTAWRGKALRGPRVWHAYVYLNQDLEPDCTAAETT